MSWLTDDRGNQSSMRLVAVLWSFVVLVVWAVLCVMSGHLLDMPMGIVALLTALWANKVLQKFAEGKGDSDTN